MRDNGVGGIESVYRVTQTIREGCNMSRLRLPSNWPDSWNLKQNGEEYLVNQDTTLIGKVYKSGKEWHVESDLYGDVPSHGLNTLHDILHELVLVHTIMEKVNNKVAPKKADTKVNTIPLKESLTETHSRFMHHIGEGTTPKDIKRIYEELERVSNEYRLSTEFAVMTGRQWSEAVSEVAKLEAKLEEAVSAIQYAQQKGFKWPSTALTFLYGGSTVEH